MKFKRLLSCVLIITVLLMQNVMIMSAEEASDLIWIFDEVQGLLYIEGEGAMPDYKADAAPWYEYASRINSIVIGGDLTSVGRYAFRDCTNVQIVDIESKKLETICEAAFLNCAKITTIGLPASLKLIDVAAFYNSRYIKEVVFNGTQEQWNEIDFTNNKYLQSANVIYRETPDDTETYYTNVEFEVITDYRYGEDFYCEVYGYDAEGNRCEIPLEECTIEGYDKYLTNVEQEVIISYGEYSHICHVFVHDDGAGEPSYEDVEFGYVQTEYKYGEGFYAEIYVYNENGERIQVDDYTVDGFDCIIPGKQEVIVSYNGVSQTYIVTVYDKQDNTSGGGSGGGGSGGSITPDIPTDEAQISWAINGDGILTVYGDGEIPDYEGELPPWEDFKYDVRAIVITENITSIGSSAFENCHETEYVYIESDVEIIKDGAFENCHNIKEIYFPESIRVIEEGAFRHCDNIRRIHYRGTREQALDIICNDEYIIYDLIDFGCNCVPELESNSGVIVEEVWCDYYIGDEFYAEVYVYDSNNILTQIPLEECIIEGFDSSTPGVQEVTLSYGEHSFTYIVTVHGDEAEEPDPEIPSGKVIFENIDVTYYPGDEFYAEIYVYTDDGEAYRVPIEDCIIEGFDSYTPGVQTVTISYGGYSETTRVRVYAYEDESKVEFRYVQTEYEYGEAFYAEVYTYTSDGMEQQIFDYTVEGFDCYSPGSQEVTIIYGEHSYTVTVTVYEEVVPDIPEEPITVSFENVKTEYNYGEDFYIEIYKIENGVQERVYDYTVDGFDAHAPGVQNVTVYYNEFSYEVDVVVCNGDNLRWKYNPQTKEFYYFGAGQMPEYGNYAGIKSPAPWCDLLKDVETITIGDAVTSIAEGAFSYCYNLKTINFGKNLRTIDRFAFERAESLESVSFPDSLKTLGANAFRYCKELSNVTFGSGLTELESAFVSCTKLKTITLPEGLIKIGVHGFLGCDGLEEIYLPSTLTQIDSSAFLSNRSLKDVYYNGTVNDWSEILINSGNDCLTDANIHCTDGDVSKEEEPVEPDPEPEPVVEIVYENVKTEYAYGEDFYIEVYQITDGVKTQVYDYKIIDFNKYSPGNQWVNVIYGDYSKVYEIYVNEEVVEPVIEITFENVKTEYEYGEEFYIEVYEVSDGMMKQVYDYTVDGFDSLKSGSQTVIVRYGEYEEAYTVYVKAVVEPEPEVPVDPENAPTVTVSSKRGRIGDTVDVTVSLSKNTGFANLGLEIEYDRDAFTLVNVTGNSNVGAIFTKAQSLEAYPYNIGWDSISNNTYNGELVTLTFAVNENAMAGEYAISVDFYKGKNGDYTDGNAVNYDENEKALGLVYLDGAITVYDYIPGDINDDGYVNNKDGTAILRYLAGWTLENINESALDTDGDGTITNKDGTRLLRYLAGWDVEIN